MSDPFDPPAPGGRDFCPDDQAFPWDERVPADPEASSSDLSSEAPAKEEASEEGPRERHDAFTEARKSEYLKALVKTGGIKDACRKTGISRRTVYRHQEDDPGFFENCRIALRMSGTPVEITAWQRAVEGVEQEFVVGGEVRVRRRYDAGLLRLLLQGSNPKKYGPRPGFKRKRLLKHERKQMEREIRAEMKEKEKRWTFDESIEELNRKLEIFGARHDAERLAAGWTRIEHADWPKGYLIPPGYAPIPGWQPPAAPCEGAAGAGEESQGESDPRDSM